MRYPERAKADDERRLDQVRGLVADLRDLAVDMVAGGYTRTALAMFGRDLQRAAPGALGASITVEPGSTLVAITVHLAAQPFEPVEVVSTLAVCLPDPDSSWQGRAVFYASTFGAFDDLAVDLRVLLGPTVRVDDPSNWPVATVLPSVEGLDDHSQVYRAIGVLVGRGLDVGAARADLELRAARSGTTLPDAARTLLTSTA